jgi:hypothetical protein
MGGTVGIANKLYQSAAPTSDWITQTHTIDIAAGATSFSFDDGGTAFTKNQMAGGTVVFEETDDLGHIYKIKKNDVTSATETIMYLEDGVSIQVAMAAAASNVLTALLNQWQEIIISPAGINSAANAGVPRVIVPANQYGWIQTRGVASCLIDSGAPAVLIGNSIRGSESAVGAVALVEESAGILDYMQIGYCLETAPDADFGHIFLQIE